MVKMTFNIPPVAQDRPRARHIPTRWIRCGIYTKRIKARTYLYDPPKVKIYKAQLGMLARAQFKQEPLTGPLKVNIVFFRPNQKGISKKKLALREQGNILPTKKPDLSNFLKSFEDALNGIVWKDDALIVKETIEKRYSVNPRIEMTIYEIKDNQ